MRLYRTGKASQLLGISKPTLIRKIKSGEIKAYRVGRECRIPESEIKRLLEGKLLIKSSFMPEFQAETRKRTWRDRLNILKTTALPRVIKL